MLLKSKGLLTFVSIISALFTGAGCSMVDKLSNAAAPTQKGVYPDKIVLVSGDKQLAAPNSSVQPIIFQVLDANKVPVANAPLSVSIVTGDGVVEKINPTSDSKGNVKVLWTLGRKGGANVISVTAFFPLTLKTQTVLISALAVAHDPSKVTSTITGTSSITADGTSASVVTVTLLDDTSVPVQGLVPTFSATDTGSTNVYGVCSATDVNGVSTCTLTSKVAETKALQITSPATASGGTGSGVTFIPGTASKIVFSTSPSTSGNTDAALGTQPVVIAQDAFGNGVPSYSGTVTFNGYADSSCSTLVSSGVNSGTSSTSAGAVTFSGVTILKTNIVAIKGTDGTISSPCLSGFTISPGALNALAFTTQPSAGPVSGVSFAQQPIVTAYDANGNLLGPGTSVVLTLTSGTPSLACASSTVVTNAVGASQFIACKLTGLTGSYTLTASAGSKSVVSSNIVLGAETATQLVFTTTPGMSSTTDAALSAQPGVTAKDGSGVTALNYSGTVTFNGYLDSSCNTQVAGALNSGTPSRSLGVTTFSGVKILKINVVAIKATDGSLSSACLSGFSITPGALNSLAFSTQPAGATSGINLTQQPAVTAYDANNNALSSGTSIALALTSGTPVLACGTNPVGTNSSGLAQFAACKLTGAVGTYTLTATSGAKSVISSSMVLGSTAATQLVITTTPGMTSNTDTALSAQPGVTAKDGSNNVSTNYAGTITFNGYSDSSCNTQVTGAVNSGTPTKNLGVVSFSGVKILKTNVVAIKATDGTLSSSCLNGFTITPGALNSLAFTTQPSTSASSALGFGQQPAVTAVDANNNTLNAGTAITLSITSGTPVLACTTNPVSTNSTGLSQFAGCNLTGVTGTYTLTATSGAKTVTSTNIALGAGNANQLVVTTNPSTTGNTDTALSVQPGVTAKDGSGNTATAYAGTVSFIGYSDAGCTAQVVSSFNSGTPSNSSGVVSFSGVKILKTSVVAMKATDGTLTSACFNNGGANYFTISPGAAASLTFSTDPGTGAPTYIAGTALSTQPVVKVYDANSNLKTDFSGSIALTADTSASCGAPADIASGLSATTNPVVLAGSATASFAAVTVLKTNAVKLRASSGSLSACSSTFTVNAGGLDHLTFTADPGTGSPTYTAGTAFSTQPIVTLYDVNNNVLSNIGSGTVTLAQSSGTLSAGATSATIASGVANFSGMTTQYAAVGLSLTASYGGKTVISGTYTVNPTAIASLSFNSFDSTGIPNTVFTTQPVVTAYDQYSNVVFNNSSTNITFTGYSDSCSTAVTNGITATTNPLPLSAGIASFAAVTPHTNALNVNHVRASDGTHNTACVAISIAFPAVTGWSLGSVTSGTTSCNQTPVISGSDTYSASTAVTANLYVGSNSTPNCSGSIIGSASISSGAISISNYTASGTGSKYLYYTLSDANSNTSSCAYTGLNYDYETGLTVAFSSMGYSVLEYDGSSTGVQTGLTPVTVNRTYNGSAIGGCTTTVSLTSRDVSAITGTDYTVAGNAISVSITGNNTSDTVPVASLGLTHNTATTGDQFYELKIGSVTGTGSAGTSNQVAQVNTIDYELNPSSTNGNFMFNQPLYTVSSAGTTASLTIQRVGRTMGTAKVDVTLVDGSATSAGSDYTNAISCSGCSGSTVTFGSGVAEMPITITVSPTGTHNNGANTSFIVKLTNPKNASNALDVVRNLSVAKVRIMNDAGPAAVVDGKYCDSTQTHFGNQAAHTFNASLTNGNGTTVPYTVCSITQLNYINTNNVAGANVNIMADLVNGAGGSMTSTEPEINLSYSGIFNGNEYAVSGYSALNVNAPYQGFFTTVNGTPTIKNLNLLNETVTQTVNGSTNQRIGGLFASVNTTYYAAPVLSNILVTGYVNGGYTYAGLIAGYMSQSSPSTVTFTNLITLGTVAVSTTALNSVLAGGMFGQTVAAGAGSVITMTNLFNLANFNTTIHPFQAIGGIVGYAYFTSPSISASATGLENRGYISGSGSASGGPGGIGGVFGTVSAATSPTTNPVVTAINYGVVASVSGNSGGIAGGEGGNVDLSHSTNYGAVSGTTAVGGIVGNFTPSTITESSLVNYGAINGGTQTGGIFGIAYPPGALTISGASNYGAVTGTTETAGIVGVAEATVASAGVTISGSSNSGAISGTTMVGGVVGGIVFGTSNAMNVNNAGGTCSNSGTVIGTSTAVGGIVGEVQEGGAYTNSNATIAGCSNASAATIQGVGQVAGILGYGHLYGTGGGNTLTLQGNSNAADVTSTGNYVGGIVGFIDGFSANTLTGNSSTYASGHGSIACSNCGTAGGILGGWTPGGASSSLVIGSTGCANGGTTGTKNCTVDSISSSPVSGTTYVGGAIGNLALGSNTGLSVSVTDSTASGNVTTTYAGNAFAGGFLGALSGAATGSITLQRLHASGNVTGVSSTATTSSSSSYLMGGLIGELIIQNTVANLSATISRLGATGNVTGGDGSTARLGYGGLIGYYYSVTDSRTISEVYATGNVSVETVQGSTPTYSSTGRSIGGLIGFIASGYPAVTITDGYFSGTLTGGNAGYWGGLSAFPSVGSNTYNNSYFAYYAAGAGQNHSVPATSSAGTYGVSWLLNGSSYYADSSNDADYSGWDFTNIWNPATSTSPPTLR